MDAKELRIGNFVKQNKVQFTDWIFGVTDLKEMEVVLDARMIYMQSENPFCFSAVPLTEEWLLKFGFTKCSGSDVDFNVELQKGEGGGHSDYYLHVDFGEEKEDGITISLVSGESEWLHTECKHVHQLQNLFYCLRGKELELNTQTT